MSFLRTLGRYIGLLGEREPFHGPLDDWREEFRENPLQTLLLALLGVSISIGVIYGLAQIPW